MRQHLPSFILSLLLVTLVLPGRGIADMDMEEDALDAGAEVMDADSDFVPAPELTLTSVMPVRVEAATGARIRFEGTGFVPGTRAFIGLSFMEDPFYSSQESMSWNIPLNLPPNIYAARVESPDGQMAEIPAAIEVVESMTGTAPLVVSIAPNPVEPGAEVMIDGAAFQDGAAVVFDERFSPLVAFVDTSELSAVVPQDLPEGDYPVYVINPSGRTGQSPELLTVVGPSTPENPTERASDCACSTRTVPKDSRTWPLLSGLIVVLIMRRQGRRLKTPSAR